MREYSKYIIYVDESGDHGLETIDAAYPIFILSFCCFKVTDYIDMAVPAIQKLKFKYFGHDQIILHEHHIRKQKGDFAFLRTDATLRENFINEINGIVEELDFKIYSVIIDKNKLKTKYNFPINPYDLGMRFGLERIYNFLLNEGEEDKNVYFIFEKRGRVEDDQLELEFRRICEEQYTFGYKKIDFSKLQFKIKFADKKSNSAGLQLADLTARPIGLSYLRPEQENRAMEIIKPKLKRNKIFP